MQIIYIENSIKAHPRVARIVQRFKDRCHIIYCNHYREVFNPKNQNFRLQKQNPALILASKPTPRVLPTPEGFGIGGTQNYYFSHLLNCPYDCRYCFLQGMYQSANYVLFVNYEDFMQEIAQLAEEKSLTQPYFFSGYDADSIAYEPVSGFLADFLPFFEKYPQAIFELRTKSANVNALLQYPAQANVVVAFSFTPAAISEQVENKVPSVAKRIERMAQLAARGWKIGLRFDPLIYATNFKQLYFELIDAIFHQVPADAIHSVSVGSLRFPTKMYQKIVKLYPDEKLLAHSFERRGQQITYSQEREESMKNFVLTHLKRYLSETLIFECQPL